MDKFDTVADNRSGKELSIDHVTSHVTNPESHVISPPIDDSYNSYNTETIKKSVRSVNITPKKTRSTKVEQLAGDQTPELERVFRKMKCKKSIESKSEHKTDIKEEVSNVRILRDIFEKQSKIRKNSPRKTSKTIRDLNNSSCKKMKKQINTSVRNSSATPNSKKSSGVSDKHNSSQVKISDIWEKICSKSVGANSN